MSFDPSNTTSLAIGAAGLIVAIGYIALILMPAVVSYGRVWERIAAGFLSLFILATLVGGGAVMGLAIVWSYDRYA